MSFSWSCYDKKGKDLFDKYQINGQGLGLAPNTASDTPAHFTLSDIRSAFANYSYKSELPEAARDAIKECQEMVRYNIAELTHHHCETCTCPPATTNWDMEQIQRFLNIPLEEIHSASGGW